MNIKLIILHDSEVDMLLAIGASILLSCFIMAVIFICRNNKSREKAALKRAEREEKRAMRKRMR